MDRESVGVERIISRVTGVGASSQTGAVILDGEGLDSNGVDQIGIGGQGGMSNQVNGTGGL